MSVFIYNKQEINKLINEQTNKDDQRAIWYAYIANVTAFNVQYCENEKIDFEDETINYKSSININSLIYNCYTNAGNCFLEDKWMKRLNKLLKNQKVEY
jgi:hypothetical protein